MEVLDSGEQNLFQWDRKLSELSEPVDSEALLYNTVCVYSWLTMYKHGLSEQQIHLKHFEALCLEIIAVCEMVLHWTDLLNESGFHIDFACQKVAKGDHMSLGHCNRHKYESVAKDLNFDHRLWGCYNSHWFPSRKMLFKIKILASFTMAVFTVIGGRGIINICFAIILLPFTELLDDFSQDVLGQLLNDPFLSEKNEMMEVELSPVSPAPLIQAEHSYSLCGDSRPQSPLTHISADDNFNEADLENEDWCLGSELTSANIKTEPTVTETSGLAPSGSLTASPSPTILEGEEPPLQNDGTVWFLTKSDSHKVLPEIKLEPHEVDQFLNLSSKEVVDTLHMPPTPPSSHGSDSEGGQSPTRSLPPSSPTHLQATVKVTSRTASALTNSPLLTAPHKLQGTGPLILTEEEKRTLIAEGYPIPTKLPLTKSEEKALKKIRRKIKNKISAQESRRKKKEYMDSLEKRVESCSTENNELRKKVEVLENTNRTLLQQLQRLQTMVAGKVSRSCKAASTQTGTCLMVVVLCFAIILGSFSQSFGPHSSITKAVLPTQHSTPESYTASIVRSRSLLTYEGPYPLEEQPLSDHSNGWDRHLDASKALSLEPMSKSQPSHVTEITIANETRLEKSVLVGLQQHRISSELDANETLKIVEIDRRVNATF